MLNAIVIGHLGGDAEVKTADGREFTTFRVAHSERWTDQNGQSHETTTWIDCIMDGKPKVVEFLKRATQVCVVGSANTRLYSSAKDKCMKAGLQIKVRTVELIGGRPDAIPSRLYCPETGREFVVNKYFQCPELVRGKKELELYPLVSRNGERFICDRNGWVQAFVENSANNDQNTGQQS